MLFDAVVWVAVGDKEIEIPIVIVVEKLQAPAAHQTSSAAQTHWSREIFKRQVVVVLVDGIHFLIDIGDEEVLPAVLVEIGGVYAHAGAFAAILAEGDTGLQADFLKLSILL